MLMRLAAARAISALRNCFRRGLTSSAAREWAHRISFELGTAVGWTAGPTNCFAECLLPFGIHNRNKWPTVIASPPERRRGNTWPLSSAPRHPLHAPVYFCLILPEQRGCRQSEKAFTGAPQWKTLLSSTARPRDTLFYLWAYAAIHLEDFSFFFFFIDIH